MIAFLLVNSREDVSVRRRYDVYIAAQRMFSTQTRRSVCIHNRNTTFFNHLPTRISTTICWIIIIGHGIWIASREMGDYLSRHWGRCRGGRRAHNSIIKPGHCWSGSETAKPRLLKSGLPSTQRRKIRLKYVNRILSFFLLLTLRRIFVNRPPRFYEFSKWKM